uniref:NADH dehydrogenase subunit 6 n=1 Tax=Moniezia expansa TaxID=28841 RepID=A0A343A6Y2_MONEX|nr:NADH dehydrogenase subunit 6 [Moniezia expansa]AOY40432.1 NADH dehydrogenase subunit 6 [Moniezia expansa]
MMLVTAFFFIYFLDLLLFCLFSHPVCYCILLVINALLAGSICYIIFGFGWYPLLFFLVYIGGVYVLFVFVSVYSPNSSYLTYFNLNLSVVFSLVVVVASAVIIYEVLEVEFSHFLCTSSEGVFYVIICLMLLFGFLMLSMIMSIKINYYR